MFLLINITASHWHLLESLTPPCEPDVLIEQHSPSDNLDAKGRVKNLCERLRIYAKSKCEQDYVENLRSSCTALEDHTRNSHKHKILLAGAQTLLQEYLSSCHRYFNDINLALKMAVEENSSDTNRLALRIQQSPRMSPIFWLSQLHRNRFYELSEAWKKAIIDYGLAVTKLQRAQRLVRLSGKNVDLIEELQHIGHSNWSVGEFPETLLLEAESSILVREEQEYITSHMRYPKDAQNIVLQLLMGGGKSTVIVPILSAYLGDKKK
jgi:hypothetical protein